MNFKISPPPPLIASPDDSRGSAQSSPSQIMIKEEWVEIIEPKSKTKIYANLESGICAKYPPEGVTVLKAEDFDDHWWELFDKKTGKYYYYNPDQQRTVWTKPVSVNIAVSSNGSNIGNISKGKLLVIPVAKLQTFRKLSPVSEQIQQQVVRCHASTQTIASNLVHVGTQTANENELCEKLKEIVVHRDGSCGHQNNKSHELPSPKSSNTVQPSNRISSRIAEYQSAFIPKQADAFSINHRQAPDLPSKGFRAPFLKSTTINGTSDLDIPTDQRNKSPQTDHNESPDNSSPSDLINRRKLFTSFDGGSKHDNFDDKHNVLKQSDPMPTSPKSSRVASYQRTSELQRQQPLQPGDRRSINLRDITQPSSFRPEDLTKSTNNSAVSTFRTQTQVPTTTNRHLQTIHDSKKNIGGKNSTLDAEVMQQPTKQVATNNLSQYLVREARAMGIALISDDELDDDDGPSDDDCENDDDEDTDLRDDLSSNRDLGQDLNASQDLGEDSSEGGWRSPSDHGSPQAQSIKSRFAPSSSSNNSGLNSSVVISSRKPSNFKNTKGVEPPVVPRSPLSCDVTSPAFLYDNIELMDDQKNPANCLSQQLDHQKLVENFKKSRQTSALGFNDSLTRSYRLDANNAVQRLKSVADTYFNNGNNSNQNSAHQNAAQSTGQAQDKSIYRNSEKYLRHLSTLSTLPRPIKAKPPQVPPDASLDIDADYDVVEENCGYYSDSDRIKAVLGKERTNSASQSVDAGKLLMNKTGLNEDIVFSQIENDSPVKSYFDRNKSSRGSTFSVESFARENLTRHPKKGGLLFNRKVKWSRMISWTKSSIKQPMISSVSSDLSGDSIASFKLIQQFMGDRKTTISKKYRQLLAQSGLTEQEISSMNNRKSLGRTGSLSTGNNTSTLGHSPNNIASAGSGDAVASHHIPDKLRDELANELACRGCVKTALRDEIFVQLARQLTDNPSQESISWGLILLSILLNYFSPSSRFAPFLLSFLETHTHQMARDVCLPRLEKRLRQSWLTYCRKPADGKEISIVRLSITKWPQYCGVFGESLDRLMSLQACSPYLKTLRLPWILTTLGDKLLETGGDEMEGIFRCAADHDLLAQLRLEIDCVDFRKIIDAKQLKSLLANVDDPHVIAGLLKLFFRQLTEPVFPMRLYSACLMCCNDASLACRLFDGSLPNLNKDVLAYLISLLQSLSKPDKVINTKMDTSNLSMVWAPNLLRAPDNKTNNNNNESQLSSADNSSRTGSKWSIANGGDEQTSNQAPAPSQSMIFEQTRQEMQFIKLLITNLDTSFIKNVL